MRAAYGLNSNLLRISKKFDDPTTYLILANEKLILNFLCKLIGIDKYLL